MTARRKKTIVKKSDNKFDQSVREYKKSRGKKVGLVVKVKKTKTKTHPKLKKPNRAKAKKAALNKTGKKLIKEKATKKEPALTGEQIKLLEERLERQKRIIMWSGVSFFMVLIVIFWLYNTKQVFNKANLKNNNKSDISENYWNELSGELGNKINEMRGGLDEIKSLGEEVTSTDKMSEKLPLSENFEGESTSSDGILGSEADEETVNISKDEIEALKKRLEELEDKIAK